MIWSSSTVWYRIIGSFFTILSVGAASAQNYTPISRVEQDSLARQAEALTAEKPSLGRRILNYFAESSIDQSFVKPLDWSLIGGPAYSRETGFSLSLVGAGLYRLDRTDSITPPSDFSVLASASTTGFYRFNAEGNTFLSRGRHRLRYEVDFSSQPTFFWALLWGDGYHAGLYGIRQHYVRRRLTADICYMYALGRGFYIGAAAGGQYVKAVHTKALLPSSFAVLSASGVAEFDSRDFIPNPRKGAYISAQGTVMTHHLWRGQLTARGYAPLWPSGVLAGEFYAEVNSIRTPWQLLARMGGSKRMRGYYEGRYMDRLMAIAQLELRQRIWRRIGVVGFVGAGNVFPTVRAWRWSQTLPNYGVGLRWEFKNRLNIRLDYGRGRRTDGFMFSIGEAF